MGRLLTKGSKGILGFLAGDVHAQEKEVFRWDSKEGKLKLHRLDFWHLNRQICLDCFSSL